MQTLCLNVFDQKNMKSRSPTQSQKRPQNSIMTTTNQKTPHPGGSSRNSVNAQLCLPSYSVPKNKWTMVSLFIHNSQEKHI